MSDDFELLARWQLGDGNAGNTLVRHHDAALATFFRYKTNEQEFEDLKQQVWLGLAQSRPREVRCSFRAYLFGIARHVLFRHCKHKRRTESWDPLITSLADVDLSLSQKAALELGKRDLRAVLQRLPLDTQLLLESRYLHEMSTAELAAMFEVPAGTIKSRLSTARKQLAALLPDGAEILAGN
jgi:RNA polymerase sigma factor (sigma-70 family)